MPNRPVLLDAASRALDAIERIRTRRQNAGDPEVVVSQSDLADELGQDPVAVNNLSAEPLRASRTAVGGGLSGAGWIVLAGQIVNAIATGDVLAIDADLVAGAVMVGLGSLVTLIGRTKSGLAPINWRRPWTLLGIGR